MALMSGVSARVGDDDYPFYGRDGLHDGLHIGKHH